jgi:NhaP-type Na+/H+ or K+/H+ antiporter
MSLLLVFSIALLVAVSLSCLARQSVLSASVIFLAAGLLVGKGLFGLQVPNRDLLFELAELALFAVLFTDGMHTGGLKEIRRRWRIPGRALLLGMPLTIGGIALLAHIFLHLSAVPALLIAAALSPTDPVFVAAIFDVEAVPLRIKHALNLESGLNDGMSLPIVVIILSVMEKNGAGIPRVILELALGIAIGIAVPLLANALLKLRFLGAAGIFERLNAFALGLLILAISSALNANLFLAAFAGGVTMATVSGESAEAFREFGEVIAELLKLAALFVFGARTAGVLLSAMSWQSYVFAALAIFAVRPPAILLSLWRSGLPRREALILGWFGPKGFASVVYALMILRSGSPQTRQIASVTALAVAISIVIYSSTDILVGQWYERRAGAEKPRSEDAA